MKFFLQSSDFWVCLKCEGVSAGRLLVIMLRWQGLEELHYLSIIARALEGGHLQMMGHQDGRSSFLRTFLSTPQRYAPTWASRPRVGHPAGRAHDQSDGRARTDPLSSAPERLRPRSPTCGQAAKGAESGG